VLAASTLAIAGTAPAAPAPAPAAPTPAAPGLGELIMDGHDAGHILYADRCSNGGNSDDAGRAKFIAAMRADRRSKLAQTIAAAEARFVHDKRSHEIDLGEWFTDLSPAHRLRGDVDQRLGADLPALEDEQHPRAADQVPRDDRRQRCG